MASEPSGAAQARVSAPRAPIVLVGAGLTVGALLAPRPLTLLATAAVLGVLMVALTRARRAGPLLFAAVALGATIATLHLPGPIVGPPASATWTTDVVEVPEATPTGVSLIVAYGAGRARLSAPAPCGAYGDTITGRITLAEPETAWMPAFRARSAAIQRGVTATGAIEDCHVVARRETHPWQQHLRAPRLRALTLAERPYDPAWSRAGQSQLLALGGLVQLALSLLLTALLMPRGPAGRGRRVAAVVSSTALAVALAWLLGATPTHGRVLVIALSLVAARLGHPRFGAREGLAVSAALVALMDPAGIGDTAFQLAFASSAALLSLAPALGARAGRPVSSVLAAGAAVALGTSPLVLRQFERLSVSALLADVVATPLSVVAGVLGALAPWTDAPARALLHAADTIVQALGAVDVLPLGTPTVLECVLGYLVLAALGARPHTVRHTRAAVALGLLLALIASAPRLERRLLTEPRATVLRTDSGVALVLEGPHGTTVLLGLGGEARDPDAHARALASTLALRHVSTVHALVATSTSAAAQHTLRLLERSVTLPSADHVDLEGLRVEPRGPGTWRIQLGAQVLSVASSTTTDAPRPLVVWSGHAPPVLYTEQAVWRTGEHGQLVLRGTPWHVEPFHAEPPAER